MIYQDYMRRKMHNVVKLDTAEGYPLTVYNCANKNLKDYTITGNTVYGENLFNYTEPYNDNQIIADEDGWFDVTIDNTEGTSTAFKSCVTKVNNALKPDTEYILFTEIAECTGTINVQVKTASSNSQFTGASIRYGKAGIYSNTITTFSSFDNCTQMLSSTCYCGAGRSGHAKFRIAVYETQKDEFLPYSKQSVGDKTENLFDISKSDGFTSQYTGLTNTITDNVITVSSTINRIGYLTLGTFEAGTYYIGMTSEDYTGIKHIIVNDVNSQISVNNLITISERSVIKIMISMGAGTTWHFTNIQITKSNVATSYEPYDKYKIPIMVTGKNLFDKSSIITGTRLMLNGALISKDDDSIPDETKKMFVSEFIEIEPNKNLTFSINMYGPKHRLCYYDQDKKFITVNETDTNTVTTPDNTKYIRFNGYLSELDTFMLEEGTSATSYEPYHEPVTTNIFRDAPLADGESINYKSDSLPDITLEKGTNIITADTEVKPSNIKIKYLKK